MTELDQPYKEKEEAKNEKEGEGGEKKRKRQEEEEEEEKEEEEVDPLVCRWCEFTAEEEEGMAEHRRSEAHRRRVYLMTGKMAAFAEDEPLIPTREFNTLEHMNLLHKMKEMSAQAMKSRAVQLDEELKRSRTEVVQFLFDKGIYEQMEDGSSIKCSSCEVKLQGNPQKKRLFLQLFAHFIGDKHVMRLRVAVKGEEIGSLQVEEEAEVVPDNEDEERGEKERGEEELVKLPAPLQLTPYQLLTAAEAAAMMVAMATPLDDEDDETPEHKKAREVLQGIEPAPQPNVPLDAAVLQRCTACRTGLMPPHFMMRHIDSKEHKAQAEPAAWRLGADLSAVYEHGPGTGAGGLFLCLLTNSGYFTPEQLLLHLGTAARKEVERCEDREARVARHAPRDPPRCDTCDRYFATEEEEAAHLLTRLHSIRTDQLHDFPITAAFEANNDLEELVVKEEVKLPMLPSKVENQKGLISMVFESSGFVVIQFEVAGGQVARALFDKTRVMEKAMGTRWTTITSTSTTTTSTTSTTTITTSTTSSTTSSPPGRWWVTRSPSTGAGWTPRCRASPPTSSTGPPRCAGRAPRCMGPKQKNHYPGGAG